MPSRLLQKTNYFLRRVTRERTRAPELNPLPVQTLKFGHPRPIPLPPTGVRETICSFLFLGSLSGLCSSPIATFCFSSWKDLVQVCYHSLAEGCGGCKLSQLRAAYTVITPFDLLPTFRTACLFCRKIHNKSATRPRFCYQTYLGKNVFCHM